MFYVYGTAGHIFTGTLEALSSDRKIESINRIGPAARAPDSHSREGGDREAVKAYRQAIQAGRQNRTQLGPLLHAKDIMTSPVVSVPADTSIHSALRLMRKKHIRHLPILARPEAEGGLLAGMVTERDFFREVTPASRPVDSRAAPISSLMKSPVYSADALTDIRRVARLMFEKHIGCMPVVSEGGSLLGIITRSDILRAMVNHPSFDLWG